MLKFETGGDAVVESERSHGQINRHPDGARERKEHNRHNTCAHSGEHTDRHDGRIGPGDPNPDGQDKDHKGLHEADVEEPGA